MWLWILLLGVFVHSEVLVNTLIGKATLDNTGPVFSTALSSDGRYIASGGADGTVQLWDARTGALLHRFAGHTAAVDSVAFSLDGQQVVSGSRDATLKLWDIPSRSLLHNFTDHTDRVLTVAFAFEGQHLISGSADHTLRQWDAATGDLIRTLEGHTGAVTGVAFLAVGAVFVSGSADQTVRVWDAGAGTLLHTLEAHTGPVHAVATAVNGQQVVSGGADATVVQWDGIAGTRTRTFAGDAPVLAVALSADGARLFAGDADGAIHEWDARTGALVHTFAGHRAGVASLAFSDDVQWVVSASANGTVKMWSVDGRGGWAGIGEGGGWGEDAASPGLSPSEPPRPSPGVGPPDDAPGLSPDVTAGGGAPGDGAGTHPGTILSPYGPGHLPREECRVGAWSPWRACSALCGGGNQSRTRSRILQSPAGATGCPPLLELRVCNPWSCPPECAAGGWSPWGACSLPCGNGTRVRTRTLNETNGTACRTAEEAQGCNSHDCAPHPTAAIVIAMSCLFLAVLVVVLVWVFRHRCGCSCMRPLEEEPPQLAGIPVAIADD